MQASAMSSVVLLLIATMGCLSSLELLLVLSRMSTVCEGMNASNDSKLRIARLKLDIIKLMQDTIKKLRKCRQRQHIAYLCVKTDKSNACDGGLYRHHAIPLLQAWDVLEELLQRIYRKVSMYQQLVYLTLLFFFFSEYPNSIRHCCTTMPWTIWPSLVVLWCVCWMFYPFEADSGVAGKPYPIYMTCLRLQLTMSHQTDSDWPFSPITERQDTLVHRSPHRNVARELPSSLSVPPPCHQHFV
jgi:hypothetical protein